MTFEGVIMHIFAAVGMATFTAVTIWLLYHLIAALVLYVGGCVV